MTRDDAYDGPLSSEKRIFCNNCRTFTNHKLVASHQIREPAQEYGTASWDGYLFLFWMCAGCEWGSLEELLTDVERVDAQGNKYFYHLDFYPERRESNRFIRVFAEIPPRLDKIYRESIEAFNSNLHILCAIGLRGLLEGICDDQKIAGANIYQKINGLSKLGLGKNLIDSLHSFRFIGNEAIHELTTPDKDDLGLALDVIEDLLNFLYELDYNATQLNERVGRRKRGGEDLELAAE